jgi:DNA-binding response OmpR family regulator
VDDMIDTMPKVLVVDDDPDILDLLSFRLGMAGFEIHTATHGADALESAARFPPDAVLLDWVLPEVDGLEVCRRLRADAALTGVCVIMMTASDQAHDESGWRRAGADDCLGKPLQTRDLVQRVCDAVAAAAAPRRGDVRPAINGGYAG